MIVVTSDSYASYQNFTKGYWFDNKVVDCGAIECNTTYDYSIEEIKNNYVTANEKLNNLDQPEKQNPVSKYYKPSKLLELLLNLQLRSGRIYF